MRRSELRRVVLKRYRELDHRIRRFRVRNGLRCPTRCGVCCESPRVEASVLECLPLAWEIFHLGEADKIFGVIEARQLADDPRCVLFVTDPDQKGHGRCSYYPFRPLVCRLFGFAARRGKNNHLEMRLCKVIREGQTSNPTPYRLDDEDHLMPPVYQDCFFQIASLHPAMGFRLLPVNLALKGALAHVYWQYPKDRTLSHRRAA